MNPSLSTGFDPCVYQTLHTMIGRAITVETTRGSVRGTLHSVAHDHIVVLVNQTPFFVRTQQIVWFFPY